MQIGSRSCSSKTARVQRVAPSGLKAAARRLAFDSLRMLTMTRPSVNSATTVSFGSSSVPESLATMSPRRQVLPPSSL